MKVREVVVKTALSPSRLQGYDYAFNPYRGCQHACVYCYSPGVLREQREWGAFVDVKINLPRILLKELKRRRRGVVGVSTVTDAYQPVERRYKLTRACLRLLMKRDFPVVIQTKSALVLRDLDLLKKFSRVEVGFTITSPDDEVAVKYEPGASKVEERLKALEKIVDSGIDTWVFLGPIMPHISDKDDAIERLVKRLSEIGVGEVIADRLNYRRGVKERVLRFLRSEHPELVDAYQNLSSEYFEKVMDRISKNCIKAGIRFVRAW